MADRLLLAQLGGRGGGDAIGGDGDSVSIAGSNVDAESTMGLACERLQRVHIEDDKDCDEQPQSPTALSRFEQIITTHPPILESLLSQLPTRSLFDLIYTSHYLKDFLQRYPLAWRSLSFRLPQPALLLTSPGAETPDGRERHSKQASLNGFLRHVVLPNASILTHLDLCNTTVDGMLLCANVWSPRIGTLKHLSVRGCKNVSIKYHIVPFLQEYRPTSAPWGKKDEVALKSLYTYRCRHHRRRPYLPSSLIRRDSDSEPTHELVELCHLMGIWTDTAWCPTSGGRCYRRKDYHGNRAAPGTHEVWVPFDRLWRSQNRIGLPDEGSRHDGNDGRLWECAEEGYEGEPLAGAGLRFTGEGKETPTHLRRSHRIFVDDVKCDQCGDAIAERCETCSVRMHCMGCRKTLCASCAFSRPLPRPPRRPRRFRTLLAFGAPQAQLSSGDPGTKPKFWWAPGAARSPNLMNEGSEDSESSDTDENAAHPLQAPGSQQPLKLNMNWCCLEPIFSGGGGIAFLGPGLGGRGAEKVRAAPLPRKRRWADPSFTPLLPQPKDGQHKKNHALFESLMTGDLDIVPYLRQDTVELQTQTCPRSLCQDCYRASRWKVTCTGCKRPLCKEHDFRGLKVRKCGYRDLNVEREWIRSRSPPSRLRIPAYRPPNPSPADSPRPSTIDLLEDEGTTPLAATRTTSHSSTATVEPLDLSSLIARDAKPTVSSQVPTTSLPRKRAHSFSGIRPKSAFSSTSASPLYPPTESTPLPGSPRHPVRWEGCGTYFCQSYRPVGDSRPRCSSGMKLCSECEVWVCLTCVAESKMCNCSSCLANFRCPHCVASPNPRLKCRREEEREAKLIAELAEKQLKELKRADLAVAGSREFWLAIDGVAEHAGEHEDLSPEDAAVYAYLHGAIE